MRTTILAIAAVIGLSGCTATKALYTSNQDLLAQLAGEVGQAGCTAGVSKLTASEKAPACAAIVGCAAACK